MSSESKKTVFRKIVVPEEEKKKYLVGNTPPFLGKPFELPSSGNFEIGREEGRSLQIPSDMVSRLHATISRDGDQYSITDNDSSNGTSLNNVSLTPNEAHGLNHKDVVKFDTFEFIFVDTACADLWSTLKPLSREGAQIITLYSPKGGTGITSIAINLAHHLAAGGKTVAIADFDLRFGDVLTYSVGKVGLSIHELIQEPDITGENIGKFLHKGQGFNFLPAPSKVEYAELVRAEHVKKVLWSLEANHDFVIVDLKNEIDDVSITAWEISNLIYVVASPEIGHMLAVRKVMEIMMNQFKYPESKVKLLINRLGRQGTLNAEEVKTFLKRDFISLPNAPDDAVLTSHAGQLYVKERESGELAKGLQNLAKDILGEEILLESGGIFGKLKSMLGF